MKTCLFALLCLSVTPAFGEELDVSSLREFNPLDPDEVRLHLRQGDMLIRRLTYYGNTCTVEAFYSREVNGRINISGELQKDEVFCTDIEQNALFKEIQKHGITFIMVIKADDDLRKGLKKADKKNERFDIPDKYVLFAGWHSGPAFPLSEGRPIYDLVAEIHSLNQIPWDEHGPGAP